MSTPDPAVEATELLQKLIRFDTVNPPGNERPAQVYLSDYLTEAGFECELLGAEPERPNLVARLRADENPTHPADPGPTLCYLGHVDTVMSNAAEWSTHGPWSGELAEGFVWGRGALDMKSQVAAEIAAAAGLARSGWRPARGELLIVAVVDEETGGELGAQWICREHPEKVRCDLLVNEGGGAVPHAHPRRRRQARRRHEDVADERAVQAPEVAHPYAVLARFELRVQARDRRVVDDHVGVRRGSHDHGAIDDDRVRPRAVVPRQARASARERRVARERLRLGVRGGHPFASVARVATGRRRTR